MPDRLPTDLATAATALSSPWWLDLIHYGYQGLMASGAAVLLLIRIGIAWREWQAKRHEEG